MNSIPLHIPVLLEEVIAFLRPERGEFFIDGTIDGGGHARVLFDRIGKEGLLLGIDWDETFIEERRKEYAGRKNVFLFRGNYADLPAILKEQGLGRADGLLLDLGFSSLQLESSGRGFSFTRDEPLLMTYDADRTPVKELLKSLNEEELAGIIARFSGEKFSGRIARAIVQKRKSRPIETSLELAELVRDAVPPHYERGRIDPATRTFQALRMYANNELGNLETVLQELPRILKPGGRVGVITFHSLEDKIVKDNFNVLQKEGRLMTMTKKPIGASRGEQIENPRSRSAKLRVATIT